MRDTAAWCIGRVCDTCEEVVTRQEILAPMLPALSTALQQEPRVAANVCWVMDSATCNPKFSFKPTVHIEVIFIKQNLSLKKKFCSQVDKSVLLSIRLNIFFNL